MLSELVRPGRDGATRCPVCDQDGFEPVWLDRAYVRSVGCGTVYRRTALPGLEVLGSTSDPNGASGPSGS